MQKDNTSTKSNLRIILIVPIYNRADDLLSFNRDKLPKEITLLFVDDFSTDGSKDIIGSKYRHDICISSNYPDAFWGGAIDSGIAYLKSNSLDKNYDYFGYMNIDLSVNFSNFDLDYLHDEEAIYFSKFKLKDTLSPYGRSKSFSLVTHKNFTKTSIAFVGGFFCMFPVNTINLAPNLQKLGFPHYYGDYVFSNEIKLKSNLNIIPLKNVTAEIIRDDKKRINSKTIRWLLTDIRSPYNLMIGRKFMKVYLPKYPFVIIKVLATKIIKSILISFGLFKF